MTTFPFTNPIFQPAMRAIAAISNSNPMQVTTTINHLYITGLVCRLYIPVNFGMLDVNQLEMEITVTGLTTFTMPIDSTAFTPFVIPPPPPALGHNATPAQVVNTGENTLMLNGAVRNITDITFLDVN